jgi:Family of unknown function (DUF6262)
LAHNSLDKNTWERNIDGLRSHAQRKAVETAQRAEEAIARLLREQRPVNFKTVAETAGISTAWLYGNETLKQPGLFNSRQPEVPKRHETRTHPMMNYSIGEEARELAGWSKESEALSIYQALETIEDIRSNQGKRYG